MSAPKSYNVLLDEVSSIHSNSSELEKAKKYGLSINSVTWEDTSRFKNSCWGSNISDMTLMTGSRLMPVVRKPNFTDETADLSIENFNVSVGNECGQNLSRIPLKTYLRNISQYAIKNSEQKENTNVETMLCSRDTHILTSAQFCILPLDKGECEFNVRLYNYQSSVSHPSVLVVVASSQGTSAQVVTSRNENLYININGKSANYLAKRLEDDRIEKGKSLTEKMDLDEQERNAIFIYQIPLLKEEVRTRCFSVKKGGVNTFSNSQIYDGCPPPGCAIPTCRMVEQSRGMDNAVLRHGDTHSEFKGVGNYKLKRDASYPIRCTVQFYKVTDTKNIPEQEFQQMREKIDKLYSTGQSFGSLVVSGETNRPTESSYMKDVDISVKQQMPMLGCFGSS